NTGGGGTDTLISIENLTGGAGNDTLRGNAAANVLDGSDGNDRLIGGAGNDIYVVGATGDVVVENAGEGEDLVITTLSQYQLTANAENLIYSGSDTFSGRGNSLANIIRGGDGANTLTGEGGNDNLVGGTGNDTLYGGSGNDRLIGEAGADRMEGGLGNDDYTVDSGSDAVIEKVDGGDDTVRTALSQYQIADNVDNLIYTGDTSFIGTGNNSGNIIRGSANGDTLYGGAGNDFLDGGAGGDKLYGGIGGDAYVVNSNADLVSEKQDQGFDTVHTTLNSYSLGNNVDGLTYTGNHDFTGTGNALSNILTGGVGNDTLVGDAGADLLDGGAGRDWLYGGQGSDTYVVDSSRDRVREQAGEGTDTVRTTLSSYVLGGEIEHLTYAGESNFSGTGNALANTIIGGADNDRLSGNGGDDWIRGRNGSDRIAGGSGNDRLEGGADVDTLIGGSGADQFIYRGLSDSTSEHFDTIADFSAVAGDMINLSVIDAMSATAKNDAFVYIGSKAFSGTAGQLRFSGGYLMGDVNGDKVADLSIKIAGATSLDQSSIVL
ncbi:calcium-binding protein, partial [Xanthobacter agilis]